MPWHTVLISEIKCNTNANMEHNQVNILFAWKNRTAEVCSKVEVWKQDKFRGDCSQHKNKCRTEGVNVLCWLTEPVVEVVDVLCKPLGMCNKVKVR